MNPKKSLISYDFHNDFLRNELYISGTVKHAEIYYCMDYIQIMLEIVLRRLNQSKTTWISGKLHWIELGHISQNCLIISRQIMSFYLHEFLPSAR